MLSSLVFIVSSTIIAPLSVTDKFTAFANFDSGLTPIDIISISVSISWPLANFNTFLLLPSVFSITSDISAPKYSPTPLLFNSSCTNDAIS